MPSKYDGICGCGKKLLRVKPDQVPYQFCSLKCKRAAKKSEYNKKLLSDLETLLYKVRNEMSDKDERDSPINDMVDWCQIKLKSQSSHGIIHKISNEVQK